MFKSKFWNILFIIFPLLMFTACAEQSQQLVELPTLAQLSSLTPSHTFTPTSTPTLTPTSTSTDTSTPTDTPTITPTATPSLSPTATTTVTASVTATYTLTNTPVATDTPTLTATPNTPQIISFTSSTSNSAPNTTIVLYWQTVSDTARIDQLNQQGAVTQTFSVTPSGELPVAIPSNAGRQVIYRLVAIRGGQEVSLSLPITVNCAITWFFGNEFAPAAAGCPTAVGAVGGGAYQPFERGVMLYVNANGLNKIYGLQNQDNRYIAYVSGWDGNSQDWNQGTPPSGRYTPTRQFRWAFNNTNAPVGTWLNAIGWATAEINRDNRTIQFEENTGAVYIDAPGGAVYRLVGGDSGTWAKIK